MICGLEYDGEIPFLRKQHEPTRRMLPLDPNGVFLAAVVGAGGLLTLLKGAWQIGLPCVCLAGLGLFFSQRRFDPEQYEGENHDSD